MCRRARLTSPSPPADLARIENTLAEFEELTAWLGFALLATHKSKTMKTLYHILLLNIVVSMSGCAGGPTRDYYNPALVDGPKFKGPVTMELVKDIEAEEQRCVTGG